MTVELWSARGPTHTRSSAPHAPAGPQEGIVAAGRRIVQRYASAWVARWRHPSMRAGCASRPLAVSWIGARTACGDGGGPDGEPHGPLRGIRAAPRGGTHM